MRSFLSLISLGFFAIFLSACADNMSVETPPQNVSAKSNIRTRSDAPRIERQLYGNEDTAAKNAARDLDDEDDATAQLLKTAEKMIASNDMISASVLYQRALSTNPESIAALKGLARMAELRGKPQEALQAYREIIRLDNDNEFARKGVAKNLSTLGLYDKAIDELKKLQAMKGDDPETLNLLGMAYTRADDVPAHFEKAIDSFKASEAIDPTRLTTQNNLGFTYILAGRLDDAIALFEKLIEDPRVTVQHRQNLALAYGLAGRENDARKIALQDLPLSAVEKNIQSYRMMREKNAQKNLGDIPPAPIKKTAAEKTAVKKPVKKEEKKEEKSQAAPIPSAAPTTPVEVQPAQPVTP